MSQRIYNWKPGPEDNRDYKFSQSFKLTSRGLLPPTASVNDLIPEVWDQQNIGSCTSHGGGMSVLYNSKLQGRPIDPSRLFLYYITREFEETVEEDSGCYIRDVYKVLNKQGVCKEQTWPYITDKFKNRPSPQAITEAPQTQAVAYHALDNSNLIELKTCIATIQRPFVFGFNVYSSFEQDNWDSTTGMMPIPNKRREQLLGGHCVIAVGYDDSKQAFLIKNSWGTGWGQQGHFWMPYSFITSQDCDDFWVLESITDQNKPQPMDTALDITKVFTSKKELNILPESLIVRIGMLLTLDVDMNYTKTKNLNTVANFLNLK